MALLTHLPAYDLYVGGQGQQVDQADYCEVIDTQYQTGAIQRTVRDWDGAASAIGSIRPRGEYPVNVTGLTVAKGYIEPAIY